MSAPTLSPQHVALREGKRLFVLVRLSVEAAQNVSRVPLDLGVVLDRSSSMRGKPLRAADVPFSPSIEVNLPCKARNCCDQLATIV